MEINLANRKKRYYGHEKLKKKKKHKQTIIYNNSSDENYLVSVMCGKAESEKRIRDDMKKNDTHKSQAEL